MTRSFDFCDFRFRSESVASHERSKSHGISRGKNRCGDAHYSWSSRESQERGAGMLQQVSLAKPVSLLTLARLEIRLDRLPLRFNNIDRRCCIGVVLAKKKPEYIRRTKRHVESLGALGDLIYQSLA